MMKHYLSLVPFLALVFAISFISSQVTMAQVVPGGWHDLLNKPAWNPPNWLFAPVWTTLYVMIAISGWRVWRALPGTTGMKILSTTMLPYWLQLTLNFAWSFIFFGAHALTASAVEIIALLVMIALNIREFIKWDRLAAYLLVPYVLWVAYASSLNIAIAAMN